MRVTLGRPPPRVDLNPYDDVSFPLGIARREEPHKAYVTIIEGCNEFCAFCVVPYTRGKERMRPAARHRRGRPQAADTGAREVQLLGQIVNHYQAPDDPGCDFAELLARVNDVAGDRADPVREPASAARDAADDGGDARRCRRSAVTSTCRSRADRRGSCRRCAGVTRARNTSSWSDGLRETMPDIALSTDMIVGFPGETDEDFEETLSLTGRPSVPQHVLVQVFTAAEHAGAQAHAGRRRRRTRRRGGSWRCRLSRSAMQGELFAEAVGRVEPVLVDSRSRRREWELSGRTSGNTVVNLPGPARGSGRRCRCGSPARIRTACAGKPCLTSRRTRPYV